MTYLNCPACHLSLRSPAVTPDSCPRCVKRDSLVVPMFASPLPYRLLAGPLLQRPTTADPEAPGPRTPAMPRAARSAR